MNAKREMAEGVDHPGPSASLSWRQSRYGFAAFCWLSLFLAWLTLRLVLLAQFRPESPVPLSDLFKTLLMGGWRDLYAGLLLSLPLLGWLAVVSNRSFPARWQRWLLLAGCFFFWLMQIFLLFVEYFFFEEFRSRFNTVAMEYLLYPHEVFINIWDSYHVVPVVAVCALLSLGWVMAAMKFFRPMWERPAAAKWRWLALGGAVGVAVLLGPTIGLRGPRFSQERILNELANNGALSFAAAALTRHLDYTAFYRTMPRAEAYQRARQLLAEPNTEFTAAGESIRRRVAGNPSRPRLNVVIILEESLGSKFWGCLGRPGASLTPEMDRLATQEGLLFSSIYACGNRTVRGFEGVLSSFPPLPGDSIVKRDQSDNVETIARVLKRDGYDTLFLYGGRGIFDGMRHFAINNGYDRFLEQKHFSKPTFTTIWGVCDEDILDRAIEEFRELANTGKPFLGTILSVSNHKPYTYPKGRIPEDPEARRRDHAVKYSDYALGKFFRRAKQEPFWTNTIFVVVADHGDRVYGSQSIPITSYEIPLVILGPAAVKAPARISRLGCSLDVPVTVLGLIGRPYETLFFGRDLLRTPPEQDRVLLHHNRDIGLYARQRLVVLGLKQTMEYYEGDPKTAGLKRLDTPELLENELAMDTIALFQVADDLYIHQRYRLDP